MRSAGRARRLSPLVDRTLRVFRPWTSQRGCEVESECIVLIGRGTRKHPPAILVVKDSRIGKLTFD